MVDAQAIHQAFADQLEDLAVGGLEYLRAFNAQAAQFIDVEEAAPVDIVRRRAPTGQAVALLFEQMMQALEAFLFAPVEARQPLLDGRQYVAGVLGQGLLEHGRLRIRIVLIGQGGELLSQRFERFIAAQNQRVIAWADREAVFVVLRIKRSVFGIELQRQRAGLQGFAIIAAQKRHQQLALEQGVGRVPLDIEKFAVGAQAAPLEQVQPPRVIGTANGHVVGDNVEDQAHVVFA
jgi:hypothetical protein